jgi:hypothetical protein
MSINPPDSDRDSREQVASERAAPKGRLERRLEEVRSAIEKLETEIGRELYGAGPVGSRAQRKSSPPTSASGSLERELKRVRQELAQRRLELTELRTEAARALQRAEQENERLRAELSASQRLVEGAMGSRRQSGFLNEATTASEPPVASGIEGRRGADGRRTAETRRSAETLRPGARKGR